MEPSKKPDVLDLFGPWLHLSIEPPYKPKFRSVDILLFASAGFTCGLAIANMLHALLRQRGTVAVTSLIVVVALLQVAYFVVEHRRMKRMFEEIQASSMRLGEMVQRDAPPEAADGPQRVK